MRASKARAGHRAGKACHRRWSAYGRLQALRRQTPEVGAVCGKAARTDLSGGRAVMRVPTAIDAFRRPRRAGRVKSAASWRRERSHAQLALASEHGCAWHGHWIGGESPSRGELVATASRRQLHAEDAVVRRHAWRREAVWRRRPRRTAAPNASEALSRRVPPAERAHERDAQNPTEVGSVVGTAAAGHPVFLPREVCIGPPGEFPLAVDPKEATTTGRRPCRSRISSY